MGQTAVEWLLNEIPLGIKRGLAENGVDLEQAKEMEAMQKSKLITDLTNSFFSNKGFKYNDEDNWADYYKNYTGTIKKTELRIGNWIEAENHNRQKVIIQVDDGFCIDFAQRNNGNPLPLTEEWLIKFGFTLNKEDNYYFIQNPDGGIHSIKYLEKDEFLNEESGWAYFTEDSDASCHRLCMLNYIHELQNLYFAINKTELEVKNV
jgi:hypothetical protein